MKYRVTCRVCSERSDSESAGTRANWAMQHTMRTQHPPLWDVEDISEEQMWQSA